MIIFAGIAGIALWGLFNLLENLREPGLLRTSKGVAVKGCETLDEHPDARRLCPQFICQKAVIDRQLADVTSTFNMTLDRAESNERWIGGQILGADRHFVCTLQGVKVLDVRAVSSEEFVEIAEQ